MSSPAQQVRLATESIAGQRPYQEDAVVIESLSDGRTLVAVADGMGGHAAGEVASNLALETLVASLEAGATLESAFREANRKVHHKATEPGKMGMGTTLVAMVLGDDDYLMANVGDSRGYLLSATEIRQLTEDHSFVAEAIRRGEDEAEAKASKWRDALTRAIGTEEEVEVDLFGPFPVQQNVAVLLCSDGCYKALTDTELRELFVKSGGPRGASQALVSSALERGSDDNITVAIVEFGEVPRDRPSGTIPIEFEPPEGEEDTSQEGEEDGPAGGGEAASGKRSWWPFGRKG